MLGVFDYEIKEVSQNGMKPDLRIRGFDEEEESLRQPLLNTPEFPLKLPQGPYIFGGFHALHLPGIENHDEEISLHLRKDDLKGFRKYESIKKTLLHELAHMVYSEHDANFYALDKQLNQEAASLDWMKAGSQTLSGHKVSDHYEDVFHAESSSKKSFQKLGGQKLIVSSNARESSVAAAYSLFLNANHGQISNTTVEPDPNHGQISNKTVEPDPDDCEMEALHDNAPVISIDHMQVDDIKGNYKIQPVSPVPEGCSEFDSDDSLINGNMLEPDPDDSLAGGNVSFHGGQKPDGSWFREHKSQEPDPDDSGSYKTDLRHEKPSGLVGGNVNFHRGQKPVGSRFHEDKSQEPDPDDSGSYKTDLRHEKPSGHMNNVSSGTEIKRLSEMSHVEPDPDDTVTKNPLLEPADEVKYNPDDLEERENLRVEPDPDDATGNLNSEQLQRIEQPVSMMCKHFQKAIEMLQSESTTVEAAPSLQTLKLSEM